jgi:DNA-binding NarL/FixJ family response regulator
MSIQPRSDLKSTVLTSVSRNAMNPFGAKDLTALAATLSSAGPSAREALTATAPRGKRRTREGWQDDLASAEGLTVALRRARDRAESVNRARRPLLAGAHRDLHEPLTAMLRLNSDWNVRATDNVAVRMIEQQRQALEVMADLIDSYLTIAEAEAAQPPALFADLASRSAGRKSREASATLESRTEEWTAEWSMKSGPQVPVAIGAASRVRRVLLINEDRGVLGALRIYLLCAGYRVFAAANADEALDRAWMAQMATSDIDIIIVDFDLTGDDDGLAVIKKTRLLLGYDVPAVLLTTQASIEIGEAALVTDVSVLRNPVNLDELNAVIGEVFKRPRRSRLAHLRTTSATLGHDETHSAGRLPTDS